MSKISDFLFGKKVTERIDVQRAVAVFTLKGGQQHTITRVGDAWDSGVAGLIVRKGSDALESYCSDGKRLVLVDDEGQMFPVNQVKSIKKHILPNRVRITYRA
jgi:hypothetical protein